MPLYQLVETEPNLANPVLVVAFDGWVDGGRAGTMAAEQLAEGGRRVATFDADQLYDYRARRPTLDIVDGRLIDLDWPELAMVARRVEDRDLLVLTGPEPDYRWKALATDTVELGKRMGVTTWVSLGAIPATVPHTRPVPILGTASVPGLLPQGVKQGPDGQLRVPAAFVSVLEHAAARAGIPALGLFAQVPHYASGAFPTAAIELLRQLGAFLGLELPMGNLPARALETRQLLDAAIAAEERTRAYVERLEQMADEARLPAGDDLIADIERFLREGGSGGSGGGGDDGGRKLN
ncbi:MAG TPA: PAC2 family protein [candidate division Zixibacteria bacterium]|nr:PAC2 family protein [candidate division Zixibacteria bacterium]